ncbi:MAG: ATP-grasp domain-containing protein [bacterium]|nr:ATP-grasp domain-containing protein [bacterium]MDZ4342256.1 ATP-grasp domain-containing protein [Candidatus Binatia bacterium]
MQLKKPHVVIFFGGEEASRDLSQETGYWACQYIPRDKYQVTPVHVLANGSWQVPLGSLPQQGPVDRMMSMLFKSLRALSPAEGLQRVLARPVAAMMSVIRGRGGDDGALQGMGRSLLIPVVGSSASACQQTANKHAFNSRIDDMASTPMTMYFSAKKSPQEITEEVRAMMMPPIFVKPNNQEGSFGIEEVGDLDNLSAAVNRAVRHGDVLVQERARGTEISLSLVENEQGRLTVLPATIVVPKHATYYDQLAKRRPGRVKLYTDKQDDNVLVAEAEAIARDVYERLGLRGYATVDLVADDDSLDLLEVNTVPTLTAATPLRAQLAAGGVHPGAFFDGLIKRSLNDGY